MLSLPAALVEELARRVAEILAEEPLGQRYLTPEEASRYTGLALKTLRTKSWRDRVGIPYVQLEGGRLLFDKKAVDGWLASLDARQASPTSGCAPGWLS